MKAIPVAPAVPLPRLPTAQEARDNPDLIISLDITPPAGYPVSVTPTPRPGPAPGPRLGAAPTAKASYPSAAARLPRETQPPTAAAQESTRSEPPVDLPPPPVTPWPPRSSPAEKTDRTQRAGFPVDLPPMGSGQRFMLPQPYEETERRTPAESSRIVRDARLVLGLTRWAAGNYLRNLRAFLLMTALLALPASIMQSCLLAATVPTPEVTVEARLGATVDFSARKAELAATIRQAQARGMIDGKAVAELAALNSVENTLVPMAQLKQPTSGGWLRPRVASLIEGFLFLGLALPLALAALGLATIDQQRGAALPGLSEVWAILVGRAELFLVSLLPAALMVGIGHALFVLPGLVLNVVFIFLPYVVLFEKRSGRDALARSVDLVQTDARRAILAFVLFGVVGFVAAVLAQLVFPPSGSRAVAFVHFLLADGLAMAVFPIPAMVLARLYLDIRARTGAVAERLSRAARS